jgi:hypothetical protein
MLPSFDSHNRLRKLFIEEFIPVQLKEGPDLLPNYRHGRIYVNKKKPPLTGPARANGGKMEE